MMLRKGIFAGIVAAFIATASSVSYGATQSDLCKKMWDSFQGMRKLTGLMTATDKQFSDISKFASDIAEKSNISIKEIAPGKDKNYQVLNEEVIYHANQIDKASKNKDLEEFQVQFRRLTIACRNCHKIYETEKRLVP